MKFEKSPKILKKVGQRLQSKLRASETELTRAIPLTLGVSEALEVLELTIRLPLLPDDDSRVIDLYEDSIASVMIDGKSATH